MMKRNMYQHTYITYITKEREELHPYHFEGSDIWRLPGFLLTANYEAVYAALFTP